MYGYVYLTTNLVNGKKYIGKHKASKFQYKEYLGSGKILNQAIEKYGVDNFDIEMLCECDSVEELNKMEIYYISLYNAQNDPNFYNICKGGEAGPGGPMFKDHKHSEETKRNMSINRIGSKNANFGNHWTCGDELKSLHSKLSSGENNGMFGKHHSEKTKQIIGMKNSKSMTGRKRITNGIENKTVKPEELESYLSSGRRLGRTLNENQKKNYRGFTGKIWITNGLQTLCINESDFETYQKLGFKRGRTFNK